MIDGFTTIKTDQGDVKISHNDKELQKVVALIYQMDIHLEKAIKALEFYALPRNWKDSLPYDNNVFDEFREIADDDCYVIEGEEALVGGLLAVTTLKEIRGEKCI